MSDIRAREKETEGPVTEASSDIMQTRSRREERPKLRTRIPEKNMQRHC